MYLLKSKTESNRMLVVLAAYICIYFPLTDLGVGSILGWSFLLACWLFNIVTRKGSLRLNSFRLCYTFIALVILIYFIMPNANKSEKATQALIINILICTLYLLSVRVDEKDLLHIMKIFIAAAIVFSVYIIVCRIFPNLYLNIIVPRLRGLDRSQVAQSLSRGYGALIANSVTYSAYIICTASFIVLGDILFGSKLLNRKSSIVVEILFFAAVLLEGRRSELLCLVVSVVIVFLISTPNDAKRILKRFSYFIVLLLVGIVAIQVLVRHGYLTRFVNTIELIKSGISINNLNSLTSSRYSLWKEAWRLFRLSPAFGIGWCNFSENIEMSVNNVHNCYLQFLCETGIVGFVAMILPMLFLLLRSLKCFRFYANKRYARNNLHGDAILLSVGMQIYFLILSAMDPVFYKGYYQMIYIILILFSECCSKNMRSFGIIGEKNASFDEL